MALLGTRELVYSSTRLLFHCRREKEGTSLAGGQYVAVQRETALTWYIRISARC